MPKAHGPTCSRASQGFTEVVLSAGHRKEILDDYFHGRFPDWQIDLDRHRRRADMGDRIKRCAAYVGDTFFATYGNGLGDINLHELLAFHKCPWCRLLRRWRPPEWRMLLRSSGSVDGQPIVLA